MNTPENNALLVLSRSLKRPECAAWVEQEIDDLPETARDNCTRVAQREGWKVEVRTEGSAYRLVLRK